MPNDKTTIGDKTDTYQCYDYTCPRWSRIKSMHLGHCYECPKLEPKAEKTEAK